MKVLRKFEEVCIHNLRENMLKKYRKSCNIFLKFRFNTLSSMDFFLAEHL